MHGDSSRRRGGHAPGLLLAVAFVMFGLLGMHALSTHGMEHAAPAQAEHGVHALEPTDALSVGSDHTTQLNKSAPAGDHGNMSAAMLCVALLVSFGGLALALLVGRSLLWILSRRLAGLPALVLRPLRLATGPPPVWEFSVIRC